ncbi:uncharacterized protein ACR2FA_006696 isoform 1-T1 [Aphomia sociella]
MQRKACFPVANCSIKMPDSTSMHAPDTAMSEDDSEQQQRRQQLINFGHTQWGFNNWSWTVTKQELDFVDFANGKYSAGVVAFVSITVKSVDIHRENIGYAISVANNKGFAIYKSRKCAVTNALRETLLSFGGSVATELMEILETHKSDVNNTNVAPPEPLPENNQNISNKPAEPKNSPLNKNIRKDSSDSCGSNPANNMRLPHQAVPPVVKNAVPPPPPPVAKALPMPASLPPAANRPPLPANAPRPPPPAAAPAPPHVRPNSNVSFVLQPVMGGVVPPLYAPPPRYAPPHVAPPHIFPNAYYEYSPGPWHFTYESYDRHHGNVNLNFNIPPKNVVVNSRSGSGECKNACGARQPQGGPEGEPIQYAPPPQNQGCWIKPTIFYDGFWTEQKVKKWVAEQVEKQFPEDASHKSSSPNNHSEPPVSKS